MLRKKRNIGFIALNTDANDSIYFFFLILTVNTSSINYLKIQQLVD